MSKNKDQVVEEKVEAAAQEEIEEETTSEESNEGSEQMDPQKEKEVRLEQELQEYKDKYFYLAAEMENARKRFMREKENLIKFGNEKILKELVEVVDNFERTIESMAKEEDEKIQNFTSGVEMVHKQFIGALEKNGVEQVKAVGEIFDPNLHEAMSQQKIEGKKHHEVIQEFQKGYILNGRLIRAAKVIIANNE